MAEKYRFFDSKTGDTRAYTASEFADFFSNFINDGVASDDNTMGLKATISGLNVTIAKGNALIGGHEYINDANLTLVIGPASPTLHRIDRIVIKLDLVNRKINAQVKRGTTGSIPRPPALTYNASFKEIPIAQVRVNAGANTGTITDERQPLSSIIEIPYEDMVEEFNQWFDGVKDSVVSKTEFNLHANNRNNPHSVDLKDINALNGPKGYAIGENASTIGASSIAFGRSATTRQNYSIAIGVNPTANGINSIALGRNAVASGNESIAIGYGSIASGDSEASLGTSSHKWHIGGSLSVSGTKNFEMPHPKPEKSKTHVIRHSAVETNTCGDNLYRYKVKATKEKDTQIIKLPDYFIHLNKDVQIFVTPQGHFGNGYGKLDREKEQLEIHCQFKGEYNVLAIGTRNDKHKSILDWDIKGVEKKTEESWAERKS